MTNEQIMRQKRRQYQTWKKENRFPTCEDAEAQWRELKTGKGTLGQEIPGEPSVNDCYFRLIKDWRMKEAAFLAELYAPGLIQGLELQFLWFNALDNMDLTANVITDNAQTLAELITKLIETWSNL